MGRLTRVNFIKIIKKKGKRLAVKGLSAKVLERSSENFFKVIVPVSLSKKATVRNRLRRRVKEAIRQGAYPRGVSAVLYPAEELIEISAAELRKKVRDLMKKIQ